LADTSLYIYICVKHFGRANIKKNIYILTSNELQQKLKIYDHTAL